jgi:MFS family permease
MACPQKAADDRPSVVLKQLISLLTSRGTTARERAVLTHQANPVDTQRAITPPGAAFQSRDFTLFQCARASRILATEIMSVAVGWQVYELTHKPVALGYAGLAQFLPGILLFLVAGHCADRFDRRKILLACFAAYAICAGILATATLSGHVSVLTIYGLLAFAGATHAVAGPAAQSLTPELVAAEHFPNAVAWGSTIFTASTILGPMLGGVLYGVGRGPTVAYAAAGAAYLCGLGMTVLIDIRAGCIEKISLSFRTSFDGFRYVWDHKVILGCVSLDLFAVLLGGAVALLPVLAKDILHTGPWGLGVLRSAPAMGAVVTALWLAHHPLEKRAGAKMLWCVAWFGVGTIVFGLSSNILLSVAALLVVGGADMISVVVRGTLVQLATPPPMRGRVSAVNLLFTGASNQVGQFESGVTAQWFGTVPAVVLGGLGTLMVVAIWAWRFPEIRTIENLAAVSPTRSRTKT